VISGPCVDSPKNTRANVGARYRYNVKSYHSTIVENAAIASDAFGTASRPRGDAARSVLARSLKIFGAGGRDASTR